MEKGFKKSTVKPTPTQHTHTLTSPPPALRPGAAAAGVILLFMPPSLHLPFHPSLRPSIHLSVALPLSPSLSIMCCGCVLWVSGYSLSSPPSLLSSHPVVLSLCPLLHPPLQNNHIPHISPCICIRYNPVSDTFRKVMPEKDAAGNQPIGQLADGRGL